MESVFALASLMEVLWHVKINLLLTAVKEVHFYEELCFSSSANNLIHDNFCT